MQMLIPIITQSDITHPDNPHPDNPHLWPLLLTWFNFNPSMDK